MTNSDIRVSVVIPTKNRKEMVCETIRSVLAQTVASEIFVMDDGSTDGTSEKIAAEFPKDRYPALNLRVSGTSKGPLVRRNEGAERCSGEFLFTIDDDCIVQSPRTFQQAIEAFDHPKIGAVTLPFINVKQDKSLRFSSPGREGRYVTFMFYGGMVAFRRSVYESVGGYRTYLFMHFEEPDLSIRMLERGYVTRLGWSDPIFHMESAIRNSKRLHALGPRNALLYHWYNTPLPALMWRVPMAAAATFLHTVKIGYPHLGVLGLARGVAGIFHERANRRSVAQSVYRLSRSLPKTPLQLEEVEKILPKRVDDL